MKPSKKHKINAERLSEFKDSYVHLINASTRTDTFPRKSLGPSSDIESWLQLRTIVSRNAGPAGPIYLIYGPIYQTQTGPWVNRNFNPVVGWETSINDLVQFPPQTLIAALDGAIARAETEAKDAQARERGLTGIIARFIRWPLELREAVGGGQTSQSIAVTIGFLGQVLVGLTTSWILYIIQKLVQKLLE